MNRPVFIETILKNHDLVDFLKDRGHDPVRAYNHRYVYSCPLHGPETNPSFYVFTDKDFPYFHCFGCRAHGDVINLMSSLDGGTVKDAIGKLAHGLDIPHTDIIEEIAASLESDQMNQNQAENIILCIAFALRRYMRSVEYDLIEYSFFESLYKKIDERVEAMDIEGLTAIEELLLDPDNENVVGGALSHRMEMFESRKEDELARRYGKNH